MQSNMRKLPNLIHFNLIDDVDGFGWNYKWENWNEEIPMKCSNLKIIQMFYYRVHSVLSTRNVSNHNLSTRFDN